MFNIKLADVVICIDNKFEYIEKMCRDYITAEPSKFTVSATSEEIATEDKEDAGFPDFYLETLAIYRKIAEVLSEYNAFLMHGVLMSADGRGILLTAASGTGKSTHAALWQKLLGARCEIINGDKPLVRIIDGVPYAYGTPWCGKEEINKNARVALTDICFLMRGEENEAGPTAKEEILSRLFPSVHIPSSGVTAVLDAVDKTARYAKFWNIKCNMDISAAETARNAIFN